MRNKPKLSLFFVLIIASKFNVGTANDSARIKQLKQIAEIDNLTGMPRGGLYQSDAIKFEEYKYLKGNVEYKALFETFNKAFERLVNKVAEFAQLNLKNINISLDETDVITNELKKYDGIVKKSKNVDDILEEKIFMIDLHSKGSEGSLIDIYSFMEKASSLNYKESLFNFTALNVNEMDKAIIEVIYNQHLENKKKLRKEYKNVIVASDGQVGLYAAFELFMEGMNVTLVNDRSEEYTRNRVVFFDRKWIPKLRFFLGTEFDKLFIDNENGGEKSLGRILDEDIGEGNQPGKSFLNLIYNTAVLDINTDHEKPLAILGAPVNRPQSFDFGHLKQILKNYEGMTILESDKTIGIPFDLIFCDFIKQIKYGAMIYYGMEEIKANNQIPLTRTGKVYKTTSDGRLDFRDPYNNELPMAIVELIEEVKNEREELEETNDEEFMKICEDKKKVEIKLSKETEGEASSSNVQANEEEQDKHILYFDKNSSIRKTFVERIYGKEANVKLVKEKRDSGILVSINDENTTSNINEGLIEVEKAVSAIKKYNKSGEQMDLTEMLMEALKNTELN
uniref:Uncharacterized protein n=1 Tax=Meloidogyne javanica TaxID=6303 RepID=A0A915N0C8_MELJA